MPRSSVTRACVFVWCLVACVGLRHGLRPPRRPPHHATSKLPTSATRRNTHPEYSSFRCIGGSQTFPGMVLQHTQVNHGFPEADTPRNRVCLFENVCWSGGGIVFYADPDLYVSTPRYLWPDAFGANMVNLGYLDAPWAPALVTGPVPGHARRARGHTHLLHTSSLADNFGHALMDDIVPAVAALHIFNLSVADGQLVTLVGCDDAATFAPASPLEASPYHPHRTRRDVCNATMNAYSTLVLGRPPINPRRVWKDDTVCMDRMIAGHSSALSLRALNLARAPSLRLARDAAVSAARRRGTQHAPPPRPTILVLQKRTGFNGGALWPTACADVTQAATHIHKGVTVRCSDPVTQDADTQIADAQAAAVIVAEHGTLSYGALFVRDGSVLVSVGRASELKEVHVTLFATHFETLYMPVEHIDQHLDGVLRFAVAQSRRRGGGE